MNNEHLPAGWEPTPLGEAADNLDGKRVPLKLSDREKRHGVFPYYGASGVIDHVDDYLFDGNYLLVAEDGANLLARSTPIAFLASGQFWVNNHAHVLSANGKADLRFLQRFLCLIDISRFVTGSAQPKLTKSNLDNIEVPLPPLSEQKRIADILDKADALRRKRQETCSLTNDLPLAIFRETFKPFLGPNTVENSLDEVAEVVSGVAKGRKLNGGPVREVPYLRVANVQAGFLDLSEIKTIPAKQSEVDALALERGDVVMTEGGDYDKLGRGALWDQDLPDFIHQNHVFRVRTNREQLLPTFFVHYLQTQAATNYFLRCAKKTTNLASINMTQLRALPVPHAPLELQEKFDKELATIQEVAFRQQDSAKEAANLFDCLVHRAFKGQL